MSQGQWGDQGAPGDGAPGGQKSGANTAVGVLNFVIGGLSLVCGFLTFGTMALLAEAARVAGGLASLLATLAIIFAVLLLAVGGGGIAAGVGVLQRRAWGR